ncbi:MAG: hypothetical protein SFU85_00420 [Candidatus Methylacidiphilales bacterium]|nr:hypothetical protein [Candidatus Methylacidiphilales bacterium]
MNRFLSAPVSCLLLGLAFLWPAPLLRAAASPPTSVNQVFQFMQNGTCTAWSDGQPSKATSYLWIPENCRKVRGLLILCANVPEHRLVGHEEIRKVCAALDLAIVWSVPSFMNFRKTPEGKKMQDEIQTTVDFLQQQLDGLARSSGYDEIATVPWLPIGESGHLLMVDALVENRPERCIAGIWLKNSHLPPKNRQVPALVVFGTAQEWTQDKSDIRTKWNDIGKTYEGILEQRARNPEWPLSYVIDGHSGHFDCSERLTAYLVHYIECAVRARLSDDGSPVLKPVALASGYLADLPVPGHENKPVQRADKPAALPWYFDEASAQEAQAIAAINWKAATQLPVYLDKENKVLPHDFNGITNLKELAYEDDGLTFTVRGGMAESIPEGFLNAGEKLDRAPGEPVFEWLCGPIEALGDGRFRISVDRVWLGGGATYIALRHPGNAEIRGVVQPAGLDLRGAIRNKSGKPQKITFDPIPDVPAGTPSLALKAVSDSGLPVRFFVVSGPAVVQGEQLEFTRIPPRSKFPVEVNIAAWQWGRSTEPSVKMAEIVTQTFRITER